MTSRALKSIARLACLSALLLFALAIAAQASELRWDDAAFESAQNAGKPIVVHITASWCPICKKQQPTIDALARDAKFAGMTVFWVDFDSKKDVLAKFKVSKQSTFIAFKGTKETARSTGATGADQIRELYETTL
jgi:thioredoxin 1